MIHPPDDAPNVRPDVLPGDSRVDLEVPDGRLALDQVAVVLGIEHRDVDVVAGEGTDVVERVEEQHRLELGAIAVYAPQHEGAAAPRDRASGFHAGRLEVL